MKIGGHPVDLMMDTGAEHSVVTQPESPLSNRHKTIIRATGAQVCYPFLTSRRCNLGSQEGRHKFLYLPDCPVGLMGKDLRCKRRAHITFDLDSTTALKLRGPEAKTLILTVSQEEEWQLYAPEGKAS
jgi:hypothetical protein